MRGGKILLSAQQTADGSLQVIIADTGVGFTQGAKGGKGGSGLGLTHVRERLARIFGAAASMQMEENVPRGVVVRLTLPLTRSTDPTVAPARPAQESPRASASAHVTPAISRP